MVAIASFFADSYQDARTKFLDAVTGSGAALLERHRNPTRGPDGSELFTDVAWIGPAEARKLLVLNSATHGIEGYCGSGCQAGWLGKGHFARDAAPDTAVLLIHAINPHGFAWGRRVTEENVDLNRNFLDHARPHPKNADYETLAHHINPREWTPDSLAQADAAIARHYGLAKADFLPAAVHGGQYMNRFRGRRNIELAQSWFDEVSTVPASGATWHVPSGLLALALDEGVPQATTVPMVIEFGTHEVNAVLKAIRADNWLHCHGKVDSPQGREIKAFMREMFYPALPEWKLMVFSRSNDVIRQALVGLARL